MTAVKWAALIVAIIVAGAVAAFAINTYSGPEGLDNERARAQLAAEQRREHRAGVAGSPLASSIFKVNSIAASSAVRGRRGVGYTKPSMHTPGQWRSARY